MNKIEYKNYLKSNLWKNKRKKLLVNDKCFICNNYKNLAIHHITYKRIGNENTDTDLVVLCRHCHRKIHFTCKGRKISLNYDSTLFKRFLRRLTRYKRIRRLKNARNLKEAREIIQNFSNN